MSKEGIGYFSFDTDFFHSDKKVKIIKGEFGSKGVVILIHTLCAIYSDKGYYMEWGEDDCCLASDDLGCDCSPGLIGEVINRCVKRGIFDEEVFHMFGVLTSHGIQIRFLKAASKREKIGIIEEYALFDLNELREGMRNKVTFFSKQVARKNEKVARNVQKVASCSIKKESKERNIKSIVVTPATPKSATVTFEKDSFEIKCVNMLIESCIDLFPNSKVPLTLNEKQKWAIEIDRMKRLDSRSEVDILQTLNFAMKDNFWKPNIRSTKKFREKYETLLIQSRQRKDRAGEIKPKQNQFNSFPQRDYGERGISDLEKRLLQKQLGG